MNHYDREAWKWLEGRCPGGDTHEYIEGDPSTRTQRADCWSCMRDELSRLLALVAAPAAPKEEE